MNAKTKNHFLEVGKMEVKTYCINKGQPGQYFGLKNAKGNQVLYGAPNNWKTESGAIRWAFRHGLIVIA